MVQNPEMQSRCRTVNTVKYFMPFRRCLNVSLTTLDLRITLRLFACLNGETYPKFLLNNLWLAYIMYEAKVLLAQFLAVNLRPVKPESDFE